MSDRIPLFRVTLFAIDDVSINKSGNKPG